MSPSIAPSRLWRGGLPITAFNDRHDLERGLLKLASGFLPTIGYYSSNDSRRQNLV